MLRMIATKNQERRRVRSDRTAGIISSRSFQVFGREQRRILSQSSDTMAWVWDSQSGACLEVMAVARVVFRRDRGSRNSIPWLAERRVQEVPA